MQAFSNRRNPAAGRRRRASGRSTASRSAWRSQVYSRSTRRRPFRPSSALRRVALQQVAQAARHGVGRRLDDDGPAGRGQLGEVAGGGDQAGQAAGQGLEDGHAEPLAVAGQDEGVGRRPGPAGPLARDVAEVGHPLGQAGSSIRARNGDQAPSSLPASEQVQVRTVRGDAAARPPPAGRALSCVQPRRRRAARTSRAARDVPPPGPTAGAGRRTARGPRRWGRSRSGSTGRWPAGGRSPAATGRAGRRRGGGSSPRPAPGRPASSSTSAGGPRARPCRARRPGKGPAAAVAARRPAASAACQRPWRWTTSADAHRVLDRRLRTAQTQLRREGMHARAARAWA